jgi:hypothetical protein
MSSSTGSHMNLIRLAARRCSIGWAGFAENPVAHARRLPEVRAPVYLVETPIPRITLTFLHVEQFHVVKLIAFGTLP